MQCSACCTRQTVTQRPDASPEEVKVWIKQQAARGKLWDVRGDALMLQTTLRSLPTVSVAAAAKPGLSGATVGGIAAGVACGGAMDCTHAMG